MKRKNIDFARNLRRSQTDAERRLWAALRNRQMGGIKFRRQHALGRYVLDFYAPEYKLGIEADGGQHYSKDGQRQDEARVSALASEGVQILRFSNLDILQNIEGVCAVIRTTIEEMQRTPSPQSSPQGGEEDW